MPSKLSSAAISAETQNNTKVLEANLEHLSKTGRVLKCARMGHPLLTQKAVDVDPHSAEVQKIIADMAATLVDFGPVQGLAAPQVFIGKRVLYYIIHAEKGGLQPLQPIPGSFLLNAGYENIGDEIISDWEACLSLPDLVGWVPRHAKIHLKAVRTDGMTFQEVDQVIEGHHARVLAHEIDHLDGILYPERMQDFSRFGYRDEMFKYFVQPERQK